MGYKQSIMIVVALLILTPLAYGQLLPDNGDVSIISGRICCTSTGNCGPGSVGIPGVRVKLNLTTLISGTVTLGQGVTNSTGVFSLRLSNIPFLFGHVQSFAVVVNLPLNSTICPILNAVNGTLIGIPVLQIAVGKAVIGPIYYFVVKVFKIVSIGD